MKSAKKVFLILGKKPRNGPLKAVSKAGQKANPPLNAETTIGRNPLKKRHYFRLGANEEEERTPITKVPTTR